ncbi:molybdopterin-dependent oxidoreductase [Pseudohalocynthiibacter aestuariivivens]|nr:molybdopterin-dependent oxidoreductase [Pseudohalocynthiibacter aestuariivivens]QIE44768.1 molybdopterin-dependent oxidoreductase [Pseudohalocynthiibacter aestuariivivens]
MENIPAFCTQCRSRCGCIAHVEGGRLTEIVPDPGHPSGKKLCPKGRAAPELIYHADRLTHPMRRVSPKGERPARWERISWDTALDEIAAKMGAIRAEHGAEQVAFSVTTPSGTHMSDGIAWVERFIRGFGSPNNIYSTEICNWHKDHVSRLTYGSDTGVPDYARSDCMLLWGHNPAATWLARSVEMQAAMKRGAKLIVVDPRATLFARRADCWLRLRPGTDQVLGLGLIHILLRDGTFDAGFTARWTNAAALVREDTGDLLRDAAGGLQALGADGGVVGYDGQKRDWRGPVALFGAAAVNGVRCRTALSLLQEVVAPHDPASVADETGVDQDALEQAAQLMSAAEALSYCAWNGVAQSRTASQTERAMAILYTLLGHYGQPGGNVAGAAAAFNDISGLDLLSDAQKAKGVGREARPIGPGNQGWVTARDVYRAALGQGRYPVRALISFGGNLLAAQPDADLATEAFKALELHVHADFFMNATAEWADIVLPAATSWEREGLRHGFDATLEGQRRVQLRPAVVAPIGESRSDVVIVMALADRLGMSEIMFDCDVDKGHAHLLVNTGVTIDALRAQPEGVEVPGQVRLRAHETDGFATPSGVIEIYSEQIRRTGLPPLPVWREQDAMVAPEGYPVRLSSAKSVTYCHSQHRNIASLRRLQPNPPLEMAPDVAEARGIADGAWVAVTTPKGRFLAQTKVIAAQIPGTVVAQHGWWVPGSADAPYGEADAMAANINPAMDTSECDPLTGSIPLRSGWCEVALL